VYPQRRWTKRCTASIIGQQTKTQIDPSEERDYVSGSGRRLFTLAGVTFGICHEAFRYPEITRSLVLGGAQVIFVPRYVRTDDGSLPSQWCAASNPHKRNGGAAPALENTVYVAGANNAGPDQVSASRQKASSLRVLPTGWLA
jgi:predicted amidohydrolase